MESGSTQSVGDSNEFDFKAAYKVEGYEGVAWRAYGYATDHEAIMVELDEDEWYEEYEEYEDRSRVKCHMVGDDREFIFDTYYLTKLEEDQFCPECGQIGCGHYR